ncbi:MAG: GTPase, partial [Planctomycetia bacterium]
MKKEIHLTQDSICALATPVGSGCRGVVRITGPDTLRLLEKIPGLEIPQIDSSKKTSHLLKLMFGNGLGLVCRALVWHGSSSYTGQNVVELHLVNNSFILDKVIGWLISAGFRKAIPGEFTLRAFLSGKIDFTQVDAIHQIIEAESFTDLEKALGKLGGGIVNPLKVLKDDLVNMLADIEANLDFSQEDIQFIANDEVVRRLSGLLAQVINIHRKMTGRSERKKVFKVLLAGVPNSGKSSLMNALTGEVASLVSAVEGTTRDYVVKRLAWKGFEFDLVDAP